MAEWEPVIGLEIHVALKTHTKMFCRCQNGAGGGPNTQTCPVCLASRGAPGANRRAVEETIKLGLALGSRSRPAVFHRKSYFYPDNRRRTDLQYDEPCARRAPRRSYPDGDVEIRDQTAPTRGDAAKTSTSPRPGGSTAPLRRLSTSTRGCC